MVLKRTFSDKLRLVITKNKIIYRQFHALIYVDSPKNYHFRAFRTKKITNCM